MKSSQLLAGCILVLGCTGAVQASDMGGNGLHCHGLVADSSSTGGVLAAIGAMMSSGSADTGPAQSPDRGACQAGDSDIASCTRLPDADSSDTIPSGSHGGGSDDAIAPASRKRPAPSLGWQSLLPGSIQ